MSMFCKRVKWLREWIFLVISPHRGSSESGVQKISICFGWFVTVLILLSSSLAFVSTFDLPECCQNMLTHTENSILWIFTVEYCLRVWTADLYFKADKRKRRCERLRRMWKFIWTPLAVIDLIAIIPFWIPIPILTSSKFFMALRLFRAARLLRYTRRYGKVLDNMSEVLREQKKELRVALGAIGTLMMVASVLMFAAEHDAQPDKFRNAFSGLWWAVTTITTLGYGDITPITVLGKIFGAVIALTGVAAFAVPTAIINSGFVKRNITAEELKKMLSQHDAEQDRQLEKQRKMIDELRKRFVEFEERQLEKDNRQDEKLKSQGGQMDRFVVAASEQFAKFENVLQDVNNKILHEALERQGEGLKLFSEEVGNRLAEYEERQQEKDTRQCEALRLQRECVEQLVNTAKLQFVEFEKVLWDAKSKMREDAQGLYKEWALQLSKDMGDRLSVFGKMIDDQRSVIERCFAPEEKTEGVLGKTMKRAVSCLMPWKNKGCVRQ